MAKAKLGKALATKLKDFIDEMKDKYAMTPDQTKSAIRNYANEGYLPKDPKRILPGDDESLALMITTNTMVPNRKAQFMQDIFEQNVMDDIIGEARKEFDLFKLRQLDPKKMTKQADGGRVGMIKGGLLKGIASLFKGKGKEVATEGSAKVSKIFTDNLVETFGAKEVEEAIRIINNKYKNPELEKLFFKEGESKADDLVNLLEARYMGSTRLQAHPLSFNRRGPGAADRYKKLNETGQRLTDLPGGPGDKAMYGRNYGEMSETTSGFSGQKVYETPPTVFDEGTIISDRGQTIEGVAETMAGMTDESDQILKNMKRMEAETKAMTEIAKAEQAQIGEAIDTFNRMLDDGEDPAAALEFLKNAMKRTKQADGGRVEMALGGAAKGIMEAIKLASRGIKPFGQKQTYKQKVTTKGVSKEQFDEIFEKQLNRVPDEVSDEATGRGLYQSLLEAEAVITGQKLGLLSQAQRTQIAKAMTEKVSKQIYDNPVSGLNNDYLEYMDDAIGRMDAILEIEKLGGDLTPKPIYDGKEIIAAGIDFSQLDKLGKKTNNVIPFKPREKKYSGGLAGILRQLLRRSGMSAPDKVADKKQIQNVIRDPNTELERRYTEAFDGTPATPANRMTIDEIRDMVQKDPRYDKLTAKQMDQVIIKETIRADFAYNMGIKPEDVGDDIVEMLYRERYQNRFGFIGGGIVNTLAAPESTVAQRNAMTNEDLFAKMDSPYVQQSQQAAQSPVTQSSSYAAISPYFASGGPFEQAMQRQQEFQLRQDEAMSQRRMAELDAQQGLADTYSGMEDFQGVGMQLDQQIDNLGKGLSQGQQQIREQIAQLNPNQTQTGLQSQNVLNTGGLGNLFGLRS